MAQRQNVFLHLVFRVGIVCLVGTMGLIACPGAFAGPAKRPAPAAKVDFNRDVRPILAANCFPCHGQDATTRQAGLRLDLREEAVAVRNGSRAIVPGKPGQSAVVSRMNATNTGLLMPPASSNHRLTVEQRRLLAQWVREGARYDVHWAFRRIARPALPAIRLRSWVRNPVDAFVLARLERAGLQPAPAADRYTLLRRVSLDLTGLPPTPGEVAEFVHDRSPDAYEKAVDRLLASPSYFPSRTFWSANRRAAGRLRRRAVSRTSPCSI